MSQVPVLLIQRMALTDHREVTFLERLIDRCLRRMQTSRASVGQLLLQKWGTTELLFGGFSVGLTAETVEEWEVGCPSSSVLLLMSIPGV